MAVNFNAAAVKALFNAIVSRAMTLGLFERVNSHEPKSAPGNGLSCSVWTEQIRPLPDASGLGSVSGEVSFHIRILSSFMRKPEDDIDPNILTAVCTLMGAYSGGFTLGGIVRDVDVLQMSAQAGYLNQDNRLYRVMVITLPVVINDLWDEVP